MRDHRLSLEGQYALEQRRKHQPQHKTRDWIFFVAIGAIFLLAAFVLTTSCTDVTEPQVNGSVWQCISAPHISIAFDSYDAQGYGYFRLFVNDEITECRTIAEILKSRLADGHWEQITEGEIHFGPPSPNWDEGRYSDIQSPRINGTAQMPIQSLTPLPKDDHIIIAEKEKTE